MIVKAQPAGTGAARPSPAGRAIYVGNMARGLILEA